MKAKKLIVFDMDGVIIDVSSSYRATVRETARRFLAASPAASGLPDPLFSLAELARVKQSGGLNNDWELTYRVLALLLSTVKAPWLEQDGETWVRYINTFSHCDLGPLLQFLESTAEPLSDLMDRHNAPVVDLVSAFSDGDVGSGNVIKQIFQEVYLGKALFQSTYGMPARVYDGKGYIDREALLIEPSLLAALKENHILAIATGRPRAEAEYPLAHFQLRGYFKAIYSLDDCLEEEQRVHAKEGRHVSLSKPHPFMLNAISALFANQVNGRFYVGDMPDDMIAARRSNPAYKGVGFIQSAPDRKALQGALVQAGADHIIRDLNQLSEIIS